MLLLSLRCCRAARSRPKARTPTSGQTPTPKHAQLLPQAFAAAKRRDQTAPIGTTATDPLRATYR
jgi:hypothetical protein